MSASVEVNKDGATFGDESYGRTENGYAMHKESVFAEKEEAIDIALELISYYKLHEIVAVKAEIEGFHGRTVVMKNGDFVVYSLPFSPSSFEGNLLRDIDDVGVYKYQDVDLKKTIEIWTEALRNTPCEEMLKLEKEHKDSLNISE